MTSYVPEYLKSKNRKLIFDLFLKHKFLSRAEIVRMTKMSFPTASKAVDFLLSRNIIQETDEQDTETKGPGRKRTLLRFNSSAYCAVALNFEGQIVEISLVDLSGHMLSYEMREFTDFQDEEAMRALGHLVAERIREAPSPVLGVGVGLPANVNPEENVIVAFFDKGVKTPQKSCELFAPMVEQLDVELFAENDVNLACKGEIVCQQGDMPKENICYLTLGSGFGAGIMLQGKLWEGSSYRAGEIGHMMLRQVDPRQDITPQVVRLEDCINIQAIDKHFGIHLLEEKMLSSELRGEIQRFILPGLATAVYNFTVMFDVDTYILSGYVLQCLGQPLLDELKRIVTKMLEGEGREVWISGPSSPYSSLIGAASYVFDRTILNELQG